jgi:multidrug efflux system outer membrane protein
LFLRYLFASLLATLTACSHSAIAPETENPSFPATWARGGEQGSVELNWLERFEQPQLPALIDEAIANNYSLAQEQFRLYQAEQTVIITRANRFPTLDVSIDGSRRGFDDGLGTNTTTQSFNAAVDGRWDVGLWGRLNKQQQAAQLELEAQRAGLQFAERNLAARTAGAFFNVMQAKQLLEVARRRLDISEESHDIVASGYRQGLNSALDLYLARNQVERDEAGYAQQEQTYSESVADLQLALARYPDGRMEIDGELPVITDPLPAGMPSELLTRRPDVQEAWLNLLAADADLASSHKARFPSLSLVGSTGITSLEFSDLLDIDDSFWSLSGGVTQPLFNAGRLRALEDQAAARVQLVEQQYLQLVYRAFADVENAISRATSLQHRYESFQDAETNSSAALELALEQYQRGLVDYTSVVV